MASTVGTVKMFRVVTFQLVQILKIWLNTQSHKPLNERKQKGKFFFLFPEESTETDGPNKRVPGWMNP